MSTIFVVGHRNPDMDSITASVSYSYLKNKTDKDNTYIPIRIGHMNASTKAFFEKENIEAPLYMKDAFIHINKIYTPYKNHVDVNDPIYKITKLFQQGKARTSIIPVFENGVFKSLLSIDEISRWFLQENHGERRPVYDFYYDNWDDVIKGFFIKRTEKIAENASIMVAAMNEKRFEERLKKAISKGCKLVVVMGAKQEYIDIAVKNKVSALIFVGSKQHEIEKLNLNNFEGEVFVSHQDTAETIRALRLSSPIKSLLTDVYPIVYDKELFDDVRHKMIASELRGFPVFDSSSKFIGYVSRRNFLEKPTLKFALVDHNESEQSIPGLDEAEITEIVDHHRIAMERTKNPIYVFAEPLGSTNTIIYQLFKRWHVNIPVEIAKVMLAGILSDTVALKSPTTTLQDRKAVNTLLKIANIKIEAITDILFNSACSLNSMDPRTTILSDFKQYEEGTVSFGIGQCEVNSLHDISKETIERFHTSLEDIKDGRGLKWTMLLITDLASSSSILLSTSYPLTDSLPWEKLDKDLFDLPEVLSRKKQLLPQVLKVLGDA